MKRILTYENLINYSMNEIEQSIVNNTESYSYTEIYKIREILDLIAKKFNDYEITVANINESLILIDKSKKIIDLFNYYEKIIRDNNKIK